MKWIGIAALAVLVVVAIGLLVRSKTTGLQAARPEVVTPKAPITLAGLDTQVPLQEPLDASSEMSGAYLGLCKKNSIHSVADFRKTVLNDPVLASHFAGFDWEAAKLGTQEKALWTFVSYRRGDEINRTTKPVRLPKGDQYISDGNRTVRTFCCNDYVSAPPPEQVAMAASQNAAVERVDGPIPRVADRVPENNTERVDGPSRRVVPVAADDPQPEVIPESLKKISSADFPQPFGGGTGGFTPITSAARQTPSSPPVTTPPAVPEPGTFFQVGAGMLFGLFLLLRRSRAKRQ
jgi:hypothetical protein